MIGFDCIHNFSISVNYLIYHSGHNLVCTKGMSKDSKKLLVELGEEMGASGCINLVKIEDYIKNSEATWVYL